jgi:hypothetical protein
VAWPRWDTGQKKHFDGKLGIWPFTKVELVVRGSRNRPAGTTVTKTIDSVTNVEHRQFLIEELLPAIRDNWPRSGRSIRIQQDNARPHILPTDPAFVAAFTTMGLNNELVCQPPNSPDLNVLDLGFSMRHSHFSTNQLRIYRRRSWTKYSSRYKNVWKQSF